MQKQIKAGSQVRLLSDPSQPSNLLGLIVPPHCTIDSRCRSRSMKYDRLSFNRRLPPTHSRSSRHAHCRVSCLAHLNSCRRCGYRHGQVHVATHHILERRDLTIKKLITANSRQRGVLAKTLSKVEAHWIVSCAGGGAAFTCGGASRALRLSCLAAMFFKQAISACFSSIFAQRRI